MSIDGREVTQEELNKILQEASSNPKIRIVEVAPNQYKTLQKLEG